MESAQCLPSDLLLLLLLRLLRLLHYAMCRHDIVVGKYGRYFCHKKIWKIEIRNDRPIFCHLLNFKQTQAELNTNDLNQQIYAY